MIVYLFSADGKGQIARPSSREVEPLVEPARVSMLLLLTVFERNPFVIAIWWKDWLPIGPPFRTLFSMGSEHQGLSLVVRECLLASR